MVETKETRNITLLAKSGSIQIYVTVFLPCFKFGPCPLFVIHTISYIYFYGFSGLTSVLFPIHFIYGLIIMWELVQSHSHVALNTPQDWQITATIIIPVF